MPQMCLPKATRCQEPWQWNSFVSFRVSSFKASASRRAAAFDLKHGSFFHSYGSEPHESVYVTAIIQLNYNLDPQKVCKMTALTL